MSVDSTELQRATLERKDREELTTIAHAVGAKPTSRTKKADLVDMILRAAGSSPSGNGEGGDERDRDGGTADGRRRGGDADRQPAARSSAPAAAEDPSETPEAPGSAPSPATERAADAIERATSGESEPSPGSGASNADASSRRRRPSARLVGWAGDDHGAPAPSEDPEKELAPDRIVSSSGTVTIGEEAGDVGSTTEHDTAGDRAGESGRERSGSRRQRGRGTARGGDRGDAGAGSSDTGSGAAEDVATVPAGASSGDATAPVDQPQDRGDQAAGGTDRGGQDAAGRDQGDQERGDGDRGDGDRGDRTGRADQQGDERRSESESGGRRRRRRGRDRNKGGDERQERGGDDVQGEPVAVAGYLDLRDEGYGFLRVNNVLPSREDAYVSVRQVRQFGLRKGDYLTGASRPAGRNEKNPALLRIDSVNGQDPEQARGRPRFEDLTPLFPDERLLMEAKDDPTNMTARIIDLICPIGKGQRGLIVSPPKAGKTTVMKQIARSIETNNPEVHLIVLLVDERPEEVTDMRRWLLNGEVAASTFDRPADEHIQVAELTIERAKRMVESGKDVCIILDGITRLARAYNLGAPQTGRIMSGGIDTGALYPPKKFFGAARNVEEGGSLTILATALVETGSRMDEVIFEEFKGTGNMELRLDRKMAERRIYPAIDVDASSTRHEELLFERKQLQQVWKLRRVLSGLASDGDGGAAAGLELLIDRLKTFKSNDEFLAEVAKGPSMA